MIKELHLIYDQLKRGLEMDRADLVVKAKDALGDLIENRKPKRSKTKAKTEGDDA